MENVRVDIQANQPVKRGNPIRMMYMTMMIRKIFIMIIMMILNVMKMQKIILMTIIIKGAIEL